MNCLICTNRITRGIALLAIMFAAGCSSTQSGPITIVEQGSFFVAGRKVEAPGVYDPTKSPAGVDEGQGFWVDQMYVQYQIPENRRKLPLILVHGGSGTGRVWETTPDGREGYQSIMLRRGYPVYIVDFPRRGRAGYPSFNGPFGYCGRAQSHRTGRHSIRVVALAAWSAISGSVSSAAVSNEGGRSVYAAPRADGVGQC